jgi:hypothetical protein
VEHAAAAETSAALAVAEVAAAKKLQESTSNAAAYQDVVNKMEGLCAGDALNHLRALDAEKMRSALAHKESAPVPSRKRKGDLVRPPIEILPAATKAKLMRAEDDEASVKRDQAAIISQQLAALREGFSTSEGVERVLKAIKTENLKKLLVSLDIPVAGNKRPELLNKLRECLAEECLAAQAAGVPGSPSHCE